MATDFDAFWLAYPKKRAKKPAQKAWAKAKEKPSLEVILEAIERAKQSLQWQKEGGEFIPLPATWINQERWDDDYGPIAIAFRDKCAWVNEPCEQYAEPGSKYCKEHKARLVQIQARRAL